MCQAAIRILRTTAALAGLAVAALDVAVELMPRVVRSPGLPEPSTAAQRSVSGPPLEMPRRVSYGRHAVGRVTLTVHEPCGAGFG
jgi:hypothetical protein